MLKRMTVPGESKSIPEEESEVTDGTGTDSMGDISESSPAIMSTDSILSPGPLLSPGQSPARTRSHGKARKFRGSFYKGYEGE